MSARPRIVRNFWATLDVDGGSSLVQAGPPTRDGGMDVTLRVRDHGEIVDALAVLCRADADGALRVIIQPAGMPEQVLSFQR